MTSDDGLIHSELATLKSALQEAYNAMYSEYMGCPWCSGNIGYDAEYHYGDCIGNELARNRT